jgi:hypothetical protein
LAKTHSEPQTKQENTKIGKSERIEQV